jgi:DNA-binding transcriptional MerR regulator
MEAPRWTLDELAERVDAALAVDYAGPSSGRVRAVPDRRAIRWYTTIGLIDRPVAYRGRTALYGPRHLFQLVAVKRLQAAGLSLVAIQQELAGATDSQLARVAQLPPGAEAAASEAVAALRMPAGQVRRASFWREPPAAAAGTLRGLRLGEGASLLLESGRELGAADLQAIVDAARPLLAVLRDRGLAPGPARAPEPGRERP